MSDDYGLIESHPSGAVVLRNPDGSEVLRLSPVGGASYSVEAGGKPVEHVAIAQALGQWMLAVIRDAAENVIADARTERAAAPTPFPVTDPDDAMRAAADGARAMPQIAVVLPRDEIPESQRVGSLPVETDDSSHDDERVPEDRSTLRLPKLDTRTP